MKQKEIKRIITRKMRTIDSLSFLVGDNFDKEIIHDFRLSVKSLRSFLHLIESHADNIDFRIPKKLRRLYRIAGILRESALEKEFLKNKCVDIPHYINFLDSTISEQKREWKNHYSRKVIRHASKKITAYQYNPINSEDWGDFLADCLMPLTTLKSSATDLQLHEMRKNVKDVLSVVKDIDDKLMRSAQTPDKHTIKHLKELAQTIGSYNDERITLKHLNAFLSNASSDEEIITIRQFRDTERKKLLAEKKQLIRTCRLAIAEIDR